MLVLAGYLAATWFSRPNWAAVYLPDGILVSMSDCVVDLASSNPHYWDPWFREPPNPPDDHHVLAVAVPDDYLPALRGGDVDRPPPVPDQPVPGWQPLGFELVGFDPPTWHTWTCLGGLVEDVNRATGVRPGQWGLIQDERDARRAADWLTESGLGDPKVFDWVPAQLLSPTPPAPSTPR